MITISRNTPETSTSDKFIYTTLFLYSDTAENHVDAMSASDFNLSALPNVVVEFITTYYGVENGLRHLLIKSVTDGDYVGTMNSITTPHHYVCCDSKDLQTNTDISNAVSQDKKLFVTALSASVAEQMPPNKNTYILYSPEQAQNIWLWDNANAYWNTSTPIGTE